MEAKDFEMPSPKRQRTESPVEAHGADLSRTPNTASTSAAPEEQNDEQPQKSTDVETMRSIVDVHPSVLQNESENMEMIPADKNVLDTLLHHVESVHGTSSASNPADTNEKGDVEETKNNLSHAPTLVPTGAKASIQIPGLGDHLEGENTNEESKVQQNSAADGVKQELSAEDGQEKDTTMDEERLSGLPEGLLATPADTIDRVRAAAEINGVPSTADTLVIDQLPEVGEREWETDSSPYDSSDSDSSDSSDDSSDDDNDDDEDAEGDYTMLDAAEAARILMQDAGSDDEGDRTNARGAGFGLRTANERVEEAAPKPEIVIGEDMSIEELGNIEAIVEGIVLIKAKVSGEYQVLESGSLLCLQDRTPIGFISETLGRVEQPLYTVRFAHDEAAQSCGINEKGTKIFYVHGHSTFVFTQPLKAVKGSDASNVHDEEVGDDEMEFSDDEAEAEHKRVLKLKKKGIDPASVRAGRGSGRGGAGMRGSYRGGRGGGAGPNNHAVSGRGDANASNPAYGNGSLEMNYDETEEGEEPYTPLSRPSNLTELMGSNPQPFEPPNGASLPPHLNVPATNRATNSKHNYNNGGNFRGRGRGGGGGRGGNQRGRGGPNSNNRGHSHNHSYNQGHGNYNSNNQYQQQQPYPQPQSQPPFQAGQQNTTLTSFNPSFMAQMAQNMAANFTSMSGMNSFQPTPQQHHQQQQQQQQNFMQHQRTHFPPPPPPPSLTPQQAGGSFSPSTPFNPSPISPLPRSHFGFGNFNPTPNSSFNGFGGGGSGGGFQLPQQQQAGQWQPNNNNNNNNNNAPNNGANQAAIEQVQRQLEELRRQGQGQGHGQGQ